MGSKNSNKKNHNDDNAKKKKLKVKNNNDGKSKKKDNSKSDNKSSNSKDNIIDDPRFSIVHTDPRFREAPKHQTKVSIDSRFDRMFTHKSFSSSSAPVDKRGRPKDKADSQQHSLRHYYKMDEEEEKMIGKKKKKKKVEHSIEEDTDEEEEEGLVKVNNAKPEFDSGSESEEGSELENDAIDTDTDEGADTDTDTDSGVDEKYYEEDEPEVKVHFYILFGIFSYEFYLYHATFRIDWFRIRFLLVLAFDGYALSM
jgi:hypothetical protein